MQELITVIINVYNGEKFIKKCLESVINQTYKNLEILIINDGSTDKTLEICKSYKDNRIKIITTKNMGLSMSRNVGIDNATGEYIYFVDADDWIELDTIEYLYSLYKKYNTKIVTCMPIDAYDYNCSVVNNKEEVKVLSSIEMLKKVLLSVDRASTIWNKLIRKELFNNIKFENRIINDMVVTHKLIIAAEKITYSNQKKYYYLKHRASATAVENIKIERYIDNYKASVERYNYIKNLYSDFIENDIGLLINILKLYLIDNKEGEKYLEEQNARQYFKELFSFKILKSNIRAKEKLKFILFAISPKLYKKTGKLYRESKYEYKM